MRTRNKEIRDKIRQVHKTIHLFVKLDGNTFQDLDAENGCLEDVINDIKGILDEPSAH